jgi:hypothetical protein
MADRHAAAVQGVEWIDEHRLMFASDRAKADQPFICTTRDQGVHVSGEAAGCKCRKCGSPNARSLTHAAVMQP